jgi:hypothetical protein
MYTVYVKNWYRVKEGTSGRFADELVPHPRARKTTIANVATEEEAQDIAREYNKTHKPGRLSRKAEYILSI